MANEKVYKAVTEILIEKIKENPEKWLKPWNTTTELCPQSIQTKKPYRGINAFTTGFASTLYTSPFFITSKQLKKLGQSVNKGEKGWPIIFWKWIEKVDEETGKISKFPFARYYTVFNTDQTTLNPELPEPEKLNTFDPIEKCEQVLNGFKGKPIINHGGNRACYIPSFDQIKMPKQGQFESIEKYYSTLFHELVHSTGHESRLNRKEITEPNFFGNHDYSQEELTAEMGASFLSAHTGIEIKTLDNSAAYLEGWLKKLKEKIGEEPGQSFPAEWDAEPVLPEQYRP